MIKSVEVTEDRVNGLGQYKENDQINAKAKYKVVNRTRGYIVIDIENLTLAKNARVS